MEDRSVLLTVELSKGGAVRDATVIRGPEALRTPAIRAAKARKYKHRIVHSFPDPHEMMVEVTFSQDGDNRAPEVRQALPGGVSGCIYAGQAILIMPTPWSGVLPSSLDFLLRARPTMPVLARPL